MVRGSGNGSDLGKTTKGSRKKELHTYGMMAADNYGKDRFTKKGWRTRTVFILFILQICIYSSNVFYFYFCLVYLKFFLHFLLNMKIN